MKLSLVDVYDRDEVVFEDNIKLLYKLLGQREPHQNISHKSMPIYDMHRVFVESKPYLDWWIIIVDDLKVGAIYLTRHLEVGLFIDHKHRNQGIGAAAVKRLFATTRARPIRANINPKNTRAISFWEKMGFKFKQEYKIGEDIRQLTYEYD